MEGEGGQLQADTVAVPSALTAASYALLLHACERPAASGACTNVGLQRSCNTAAPFVLLLHACDDFWGVY